MQTYENPDVLQHHGVKGQRWGVRRYQNPDGSLTPAGRKRYGTEENFNRVQKAKSLVKSRYKREKANARTQAEIDKINKKSDKQIENYRKKHGVKNSDKKSLNEMSNEEIRARIERLRLENELKSLSPKKVSAGKALLETLKNKAVPTLIDSVSDPVGKYIKKELSKQLGVDEKVIETASQKLKREADDAVNRKRKTAAEDWMAQRNAEKNAKTETSSSSNDTSNTKGKDWKNVNQSGYKQSKETSSFSRDNVVDAEYTVIKDDPVTDTGRSYVQQILSLPAPKDEDD